MSTITLTTSWQQIYSIASQSDGYRTWTARCYMKYNSQSVADNTTTIEWEIDVYTSNGQAGSGYYNDGQPFELWLDDTYKLYKNDSFSIGTIQNNSYKKVAGGTKVIPHNTDGTYTETVWFKGSSFGKTETAAYTNSITLPTIARASAFTVSPTSVIANGSNQVAISITKASSGFTHTLKWAYSSGSVSVNTTIATKTSNSSVTWTPAASLFNNATNLTQMAGTLTCETYNGNTKVGQKTKTVTLKINEASFKPTISSTSCTETNSVLTAAGLTTGWNTVNLLSKKTLTVNFSIKSGATVSSVKCSVGNVSNKSMTVSGSSATCTINYPTAAVYTFTVTDSRGYSVTTTSGTSSNWIAYKKPSISAISAERDDTTPTTALLSSNGTYWNGTIGNTSNTVTYKVQNGSTTLTNGGTPTTASSGNWTLSNYSLTSLSEDTIYSIKVTVTDSFSQTAESTIAIKKVAADPLWIGKESVIVNDFMVKGRALFTDYTQTYFVDMTPVWWVGDFTSPFGNYISDSTNDPTGLYNRPRVYKQGNLVCIRGAATITSSPGSSTATMFTLPEAFRPNRTQYCICQGSNMNRWMLSVGEDGLVKCARYGTTAGSPPSLPDSGQWLVFSFTYPIKIEPANSYYSV